MCSLNPRFSVNMAMASRSPGTTARSKFSVYSFTALVAREKNKQKQSDDDESYKRYASPDDGVGVEPVFRRAYAPQMVVKDEFEP